MKREKLREIYKISVVKTSLGIAGMLFIGMLLAEATHWTEVAIPLIGGVLVMLVFVEDMAKAQVVHEANTMNVKGKTISRGKVKVVAVIKLSIIFTAISLSAVILDTFAMKWQVATYLLLMYSIACQVFTKSVQNARIYDHVKNRTKKQALESHNQQE